MKDEKENRMGAYLLGIDNGLTVAKAVVFDSLGNEMGMHSESTPAGTGDGVLLEADLTRLWEITSRVIRKAIENSGVKREEILAVANSATGNGLYFVDKSGNPFHNAILPMDKRALEVIKEWTQAGIEEEAFGYTTQNLWPGQPAPVLKWLKTNKPEVYGRIGKVLFCKDWLKYRLTGEYSTDYSDASAAGLLDNIQRAYNGKLFELYGIPEVVPSLPKVLKSHEICGYVTKKASEETGLSEGTPVAAGLFDVDACCIGSGVFEPGVYGIIAGTWSINAALSEEVQKNRQIVQCTVFADGEKYLNIDSGATSTVNLEWFLKNIGVEYMKDGYDACEKAVEKYSADEMDILFLPYLYPPIKYAGVNASFIGIKAHHKVDDLMRAVYEGIVFGHKENVESLKTCGLINHKARFTGGAANSKTWCRMFADVLGMEVETVKSKQAGALGAAMTAGIAAGIFRDYKDAVSKAVRVEEAYMPDERNVNIYEKKYGKFKKVMEFLNSI